MTNRLCIFLALPLVILATGAAAAPQTCPAGLAASTRIDLFFGLNKPGGQITATEWTAFRDGPLAKAFPQGFTVVDGTGQWHREHEPSKIVTIIVTADTPFGDAVDTVTRTYRETFQQQSVGVSVSPTCAGF